MAKIVTLENGLWALAVLLMAGLFALLLYRANHRVYPYLSGYVLIALLQSPLLFTTYRVWGFDSRTASNIAWGLRGLVITARALPAAELVRAWLGKGRGS